jgi:hypothetical protein
LPEQLNKYEVFEALHHMKPSKILSILDKSCETYRFPMPDHIYFYYGSMRLNAYVGEGSEWALIFQVCAYSIKTFELGVFHYAYTHEGIQTSFDNGVYQLLANQLEHPTIPNRNQFQLNTLSGLTSFDCPDELYESTGILQVSKGKVEQDVTRLIGVQFQDVIFATDSQLLEFFGFANTGLKPLLTLHDWYHPMIALDKFPSEERSMKQLARAIACRDLTKYQLIGKGNTHWKHWT